MNSLLVLVIFIVFIGFGYATLVNWFNKSLNVPNPDQGKSPLSYFKRLFLPLLSLRHGYLVLLLIAMTLSMHWGWAPVLLWLVIGSLFISFNLHSLFSLRKSDYEQETNNPTGASAIISCSLTLIFSLSLYSFLLVLSAELASQHSGTLLMLAGVLLALYIYYHNSSRAGVALAIVVGIAGLFIGDHMGIYIPGNWQPSRYLPGLIIDDRWLFSGAILFCLLHLPLGGKNMPELKSFYWLTSWTSLALLAAIVVFLVMQRPPLDAPAHISDSPTPHYITILMLVVSFGAINLLQYLLRATEEENDSGPGKQHPHQMQAGHDRVIYDLLGAAIIMCLLATSNGIGAWTTHFAVWDPGQTLIQVLNLSIEAISSALAWTGLHETSAKTLTAFIILLNALILLYRMQELIGTLAYPLQQKSAQPERYEFAPHTAVMGLALVFLTIGTDVNLWLLIGALALTGLSLIMLQHCHHLIGQTSSAMLFLFITAAVCLITLVQMIAQIVYWSQHQQWGWVALMILLAALYCWPLVDHSRRLFSTIQNTRSNQSINLDE